MNIERYKILKNNIHKFSIDLENGIVINKFGNQPTVSKEGRLRVSVYDKESKKSMDYFVHEIIAFKGNLNILDMQVNHIDGNKSNNKISNLECVTKEDNLRHQAEMGLYKLPEPRKGSKHHHTKLTEADILEIRQLYKDGMRQKELALKFKIGITGVSRIINRITWTHI